jgi:UDP-hydrolysing UDP-N-acetyl-D-glucosamine 2-epimerase
MGKQSIAVFTSNRADFGLIKGVAGLIDQDPDMELLLWVGGAHLDPASGKTITEIEISGFKIAEILKFYPEKDSEKAAIKSLSEAIEEVSEVLSKYVPDWILVLGDRYELLAVAQAALLMKIPLAHIHGGEKTEGAVDEWVRHVITKLSYLHFVSAEQHRQRVIQLGEEPARVFNVGAPGLDQIDRIRYDSYEHALTKFGLEKGSNYILITFHPETLSSQSLDSFENLLQVLESLPSLYCIFCQTNNDPGSSSIKTRLDEYCFKNTSNTIKLENSNQEDYLKLMKYCSAVVGNSSSGIIEAPSFKKPTLNIGNRQRGRLAAESVIHVEGSVQAIRIGLEKVLSPEFQKFCQSVRNPYGNPGASSKIYKILKDYPLGDFPVKQFYDIKLLN